MREGNKNAVKYKDKDIKKIKKLFDKLENKSIDNISRITGFGRDFVSKTINNHIVEKSKNYKPTKETIN